MTSALLSDVLLLDGLLRAWADHEGIGPTIAHEALDQALRAMVDGASLSEAVRVGRRTLDEHKSPEPVTAPADLQEVLA